MSAYPPWARGNFGSFHDHQSLWGFPLDYWWKTVIYLSEKSSDNISMESIFFGLFKYVLHYKTEVEVSKCLLKSNSNFHFFDRKLNLQQPQKS